LSRGQKEPPPPLQQPRTHSYICNQDSIQSQMIGKGGRYRGSYNHFLPLDRFPTTYNFPVDHLPTHLIPQSPGPDSEKLKSPRTTLLLQIGLRQRESQAEKVKRAGGRAERKSETESTLLYHPSPRSLPLLSRPFLQERESWANLSHSPPGTQ